MEARLNAVQLAAAQCQDDSCSEDLDERKNEVYDNFLRGYWFYTEAGQSPTEAQAQALGEQREFLTLATGEKTPPGFGGAVLNVAPGSVFRPPGSDRRPGW